MDKSEIERLERDFLIKNALDGVLSLYSVEDVTVYPIVDVLKLIFQRPVIISFFEKVGIDSQKLIYTSFKDPDLLSRRPSFLSRLASSDQRVILSDDTFMTVHNWMEVEEASFGMGDQVFEVRDFSADEVNELERISDYLLLNAENETKLRKEKVLQAIKNYKEHFGYDQDSINIYATEQWQTKDNVTLNMPLFSPLTSNAVKRGLLKENAVGPKIVDFYNDMQRIVDLSMKDFVKADLIDKDSRGIALPFNNLFFVIRFPQVRTRFDYSAAILLSTTQRAKINEWWRKEGDSNIEKLLEIFPDVQSRRKNAKSVVQSFSDASKGDFLGLAAFIETPLSRESRSIADSVFASGVIDFSAFSAGRGLDWSGYSTQDMLRQLVEHAVYSRITPFRHPLYIPIHVGGVPWVILFTMPPQTSENPTHRDWIYNTRIYALLIPHIGNKIRATVRKLYLTKLSETIAVQTGEFLDGNTPSTELLCRGINKSLVSLMSFFPYDGLLFCGHNTGGKEPLDLPNGERIWFELDANSSFKKQVDFDLIDIRELRNAAEDGVLQASIKHKHLYVSLLRHQHTIFNLTPANVGLMNDALDVWDDPQKARRYIEEARRASEVLSVVLSIVFEGEIEKFESVVELIKFLEEHNSQFGPQPEIIIEPRIMEHGIPLSRDHRGSAFLVLWNLWSNAAKIYPGVKAHTFSVRLVDDKKAVKVAFENQGEMPSSWIAFLLGNIESPERESRNRITLQGLEVVASTLHDLGWNIVDARSEKGKTTIVVSIPNSKGE